MIARISLLLAWIALGVAPFGRAGGRESFAPVETVAAGLIDEGAALFVPAGLSPSALPPSLCLLAPPRIARSLPAQWSLQPRFFASGKETEVRLAVPPGTSLYGTGEVTGPLLRNGRSITLWNTDNPGWRIDEGRRLYQSHPWVLGVRADGTAFGLIADSTWRADLNLQSGIDFVSDGPEFPVIVIDRASPLEVLRELARLTGTMPMPPRWALGYHQCRWSYHPESEVREIADQFRRRRIPCDVIWMDIHYMDGYRIFTFNPREFPDPAGLNRYLHQRQFHSVWMIDPGAKVDPGYRVYDSGTAADVWVKDSEGRNYEGQVWPGMCVFPDFTRPATRAWWAGLYGGFMAEGIDGVWNDMNEPAIFNVPSRTMPLTNLHRGGGGLPPGPHARYHNVYGLLMVRATRQGVAAANPGKRPFVLTRANFLGGQRYAATWTGDNVSNWDCLRMAIPMTLNLGLSGQPFNGPDLGGFAGTATPELWGQWVAMGAFFPFCRGHSELGTPRKEPWSFGPAVESAARIALERRYRLLPYLYTVFRESSLTGDPVMRPVFLADPRDPALRAEDEEFLVGGDLLVVPKWARRPRLPRGNWRLASLVGEDSQTDHFQADLRLRPGAIIPLGRAVESTAEESLDPLTLLVSPDDSGRAEGRLYEDAGDGYGYERGEYRLTTYRAERRGGRIVVTAEHSGGRWPEARRSFKLEVLDAPAAPGG